VVYQCGSTVALTVLTVAVPLRGWDELPHAVKMNTREIATRTHLFPDTKRMRALLVLANAVGTLSLSLDGGAEVRLRHR
jgi:hypothetical protein